MPTNAPVPYGRDYFLNYIKYRNSELNDAIQKARWRIIKKHKLCGYVLDIGCGVGAFLEQAPRGFLGQGFEVNPHCVEHCRGLGIEMLDELPKFSNYDIITMFDVIEHVPDTSAFLKAIKKLLVLEGILVIATPNFTKNLLPNIKAWKHYKPGEHFYGFSRKSIEASCEKLGLRVLSVSDDESEHRPPAGNIATYVISKALLDD